ncbi:MAG TPA: hypothetical protein VGS27_06620 [Candidatus Sulfotelmatobacter sp.]|nr:hypothetical protein [Candidatus Sulfotelmatobacter sp.]
MFAILQRITTRVRALFGRAASPQPNPAAQAEAIAPQYPPLIFLDSNNLHWARLYIDFAEQQNLPPFALADLPSADDTLKQHFTGRTLKDYIKGRKIVTYLRQRCSDDAAQVEFSPITSLEITCGLLRGNAIREAAGEGVTHRMWGKIDELEILERLQANAYQEVHQHTSDVEPQFDKVGITLREISSDRLQEAWSLSRSILRYVYLEVGDALVVSSALLAEAEELLTGDRYVRDVVNRIQNADGLVEPDKSYYKPVQTAVKNAVAAIIGVAPEDIRLPRAPEKV